MSPLASAVVAVTVLTFALPVAYAQKTVGSCKIEPKTQCSNAKLVRASLKGANLAGANLAGADLGDADLSNADLSNADLRSANLLGASTRGANLAGANLSGATWTVGRDTYGAPQGKQCAEGSIGACK